MSVKKKTAGTNGRGGARRKSRAARRFASSILFVLLAALPAAAHAPWVKQKSGTLAWLRGVSFVDGARGWAAGAKGALLSTEDGGATWRVRTPPTEDALRDIFFTDARTGWLVCERSVYRPRAKDEPRAYLLKTEDGGASWSRVEVKGLGLDAALARVAFADAAHGWAAGDEGALFATADGGATWSRQRVPTRRLLHGADFRDARTGWLVGASATLLRTTDGGATWLAGGVETANAAASSARLSAVSFADARRGWAVGAGGVILATADGGATWRAQDSGVAADLFDVRFLDAREGYAAGDGGTLAHTMDGGATWHLERTNTPHRLERLFFSSRTRGWAVGFGGTIITLAEVGRR